MVLSLSLIALSSFNGTIFGQTDPCGHDRAAQPSIRFTGQDYWEGYRNDGHIIGGYVVGDNYVLSDTIRRIWRSNGEYHQYNDDILESPLTKTIGGTTFTYYRELKRRVVYPDGSVKRQYFYYEAPRTAPIYSYTVWGGSNDVATMMSAVGDEIQPSNGVIFGVNRYARSLFIESTAQVCALPWVITITKKDLTTNVVDTQIEVVTLAPGESTSIPIEPTGTFVTEEEDGITLSGNALQEIVSVTATLQDD